MAITYNYRYNTGTHVPNWTAWSPNVSTICSGTAFQQQKDDLSGICDSQYQDATGSWLGDWQPWTPDVSTVCSGTVFQQQKDDLSGICPTQYRYATGSWLGDWQPWTPDVSTVCDGTVFQQHRDDLSGICPRQYQQNTGNKLVTWTPSTSNYCEGTLFYQTNTCDGSSREAVGTSVPNWSAWTPDVSTQCYGSVFQQTRTDLNNKCSPENRPATGTSWSACDCNYNPINNYISIPISEAQYADYYRGGTWTISTQVSSYEYMTGSNGWSRSESYGSLSSTSSRQQGCMGSMSTSGPRNVTYTYYNSSDNTTSYRTEPVNVHASMSYYIVKSGGNHFLKISNASCTDAGIYNSFRCGYPQTVTLTIEGNTYNGVGSWCPGWAGSPGYMNESSSIAEFTFNPSPRP